MRTFKLFAWIAVTVLLSACGGGMKSENIAREDIVGKWQPENLELRGVPKLLKKQMNPDALNPKLDAAQKLGFLELKEDGTFAYLDRKESQVVEGEWSLEGKTIKFEAYKMQFAFYIEGISSKKLEIDYASMHKAIGGIDGSMMPFGNFKMIMTYKRI